jgi:hypothetical protein
MLRGKPRAALSPRRQARPVLAALPGDAGRLRLARRCPLAR